MAADETAEPGPVRGTARIDILDVLRGFAILGIYFMNVPFQAAGAEKTFVDVRLIGWTAADQIAWQSVSIFLEGTQRCLLELLFGAGMMVMARRAMEADGPVAVADLYYRRNLWLLAFGLFDIFVILWVGDILSIYAVAALFLFPFRRLGSKALLAIASLYLLFTVIPGAIEYSARVALVERVEAAKAREAAHQPLGEEDRKALAEWNAKLQKLTPNDEQRKRIAAERKAHTGDVAGYYSWSAATWAAEIWGEGLFPIWVWEAFSTMLIGVALWKWGVTQGDRSWRFYLAMMVAAYAIGIGVRWISTSELMMFSPAPKIGWMTSEIGRLGVGLGHLALFNLLWKSGGGRALLAPFKAAGRMAFSLYFIEQLIGLHLLFAPYGLAPWGVYGWADLAGIAAVMFVGLLAFANLWMRFFANGPLEWLWRSLSYLKWQPFLKQHPAAETA